MVPMSIHKLGNNSVATVLTLLDLVRKERFGDHDFIHGDTLVFAETLLWVYTALKWGKNWISKPMIFNKVTKEQKGLWMQPSKPCPK